MSAQVPLVLTLGLWTWAWQFWNFHFSILFDLSDDSLFYFQHQSFLQNITPVLGGNFSKGPVNRPGPENQTQLTISLSSLLGIFFSVFPSNTQKFFGTYSVGMPLYPFLRSASVSLAWRPVKEGDDDHPPAQSTRGPLTAPLACSYRGSYFTTG